MKINFRIDSSDLRLSVGDVVDLTLYRVKVVEVKGEVIILETSTAEVKASAPVKVKASAIIDPDIYPLIAI